MKKANSKSDIRLEAIKPEKYRWKQSYTFVLVANVVYILFFYLLMTLFS